MARDSALFILLVAGAGTIALVLVVAVSLLHQSVFGPLTGFEDVNGADRLCHDRMIIFFGCVTR